MLIIWAKVDAEVDANEPKSILCTDVYYPYLISYKKVLPVVAWSPKESMKCNIQ